LGKSLRDLTATDTRGAGIPPSKPSPEIQGNEILAIRGTADSKTLFGVVI